MALAFCLVRHILSFFAVPFTGCRLSCCSCSHLTLQITISLNTHLTQQHKIFRIFKHTEMFKILETDAQTCSLKRHFQKIQRKTLVVDSFLSPSKAVGELN